MKKCFFFFYALIIILMGCTKLDTKFIASKYHNGVVKVLIYDPELEKARPGSGYLTRGSGFFVTDDGYIFTNKHVVEMCVKGYIDYDYMTSDNEKVGQISVYSDDIVNNENLVKVYNSGYTIPVIQVFQSANEKDYKLYKAEVVAIGEGNYDGALLKIISDFDGNPIKQKFTTIPIGNSDNVSQGEQLCVFGFPSQIKGSGTLMFQDMSTLSTGIMSGLDFNFNPDYGYLKTDAEIHPGNSGGPVFNEDNKVIGIATARGNATGIGLVSGINGMYYISAIESNAHSNLVENGLTLPKRSSSINTIRGIKQPIKTAEEINTIINARNNPIISNGLINNGFTDIYLNSKVFFSNISVEDNNSLVPDASKRYNKFSMGTKGGKVWIYVDNSPNLLSTDQIIVYIDKLSSDGTYKAFNEKVFDISSSSSTIYFPYDFYESGTFKVFIYNKEKVYINYGILEMSFN